ncbi:MAG: LTA synthase family protein [Clostridia bacterium]|nr:LTA synthase family protein [Clostridia bacterium]
MKNGRKIGKGVLYTLSVSFLFLCVALFFASEWYLFHFGYTGFDSVLATLTGGLSGTGGSVVWEYLLLGLLPAVLTTGGIVFFCFFRPSRPWKVTVKKKKVTLYPLHRFFSVWLTYVLAFAFLITAAVRSGFANYVQHRMETTTLFEEYYVEPTSNRVFFPEHKRNLIYIYLESVETGFFSREKGGAVKPHLMPELYDLAEENVNFSHNGSVGGFYSLSGSQWTIGAMVAHSAGIPLKVPFDMDWNDYGSDGFLPGVITLSDILHREMYYQVFLLGSDADFGGQKQFYLEHGTDRVCDYYTAPTDGIIDENYDVWWGMEDAKVYEYAKQELPKIAAKNQPFAMTLVTIDTHETDGYLCDFCEEKYPVQYENVVACASKQVSRFLDWLKEQDFYENTTVIICGDHPTMDDQYVRSHFKKKYDRTVYNCIINAPITSEHTKNRVFSSMDLFPTTLAALGCTIEGERLGLGTNLFSGVPTLCEELGKAELNRELKRHSDYYEKFYGE